jgi:hypothetical protein
MVRHESARSLAVLVVLSTTQSEQELLQRIPTAPDRSWQQGTRRGRGHENVHKYTGLEYCSQLDRSAPPQAHLDNLLQRLRPAADALRAIADEYRSDDSYVPVRLWLYVESIDDTAAVDISHEQIRSIDDLGAHLGLNVDFMATSSGD